MTIVWFGSAGDDVRGGWLEVDSRYRYSSVENWHDRDDWIFQVVAEDISQSSRICKRNGGEGGGRVSSNGEQRLGQRWLCRLLELQPPRRRVSTSRHVARDRKSLLTERLKFRVQNFASLKAVCFEISSVPCSQASKREREREISSLFRICFSCMNLGILQGTSRRTLKFRSRPSSRRK